MSEEQFMKAIASGPVTAADLLRLYGEVKGLTSIVRRLEAAGTVTVDSFRLDKGYGLRFNPKTSGKVA